MDRIVALHYAVFVCPILFFNCLANVNGGGDWYANPSATNLIAFAIKLNTNIDQIVAEVNPAIKQFSTIPLSI